MLQRRKLVEIRHLHRIAEKLQQYTSIGITTAQEHDLVASHGRNTLHREKVLVVDRCLDLRGWQLAQHVVRVGAAWSPR